MSQAAAKTQGVAAAVRAAWSPPGAPRPETRSGTTGAPSAAYGAGSFATTSARPKSRRNSASERAAIGSPPTRRSPFGAPPIRVARPPAMRAPVQSWTSGAVRPCARNVTRSGIAEGRGLAPPARFG